MAAIGIHKASQLQLAQPLLTLIWSVLLLGERLPPAAPAAALAVLACIAVTQRAADDRRPATGRGRTTTYRVRPPPPDVNLPRRQIPPSRAAPGP